MSLNSTSVIKIVDLLCEGQILGIDGGTKGIFLNETPIKDSNGNLNFEKEDFKFESRNGHRNQKQFEDHKFANSTIIDISQEIGSNYSENLNANNLVRTRDYGSGQVITQINDPDTDSFQILFTVPALFSQGMEGIARGEFFNAKVKIKIFVKGSNTAFISVQEKEIEGVSTSNYQFKSKIINLRSIRKDNNVKPPFLIKVKKITDGENDYEVRFNNFVTINKRTPLAQTRANRIIFTSLIERQEIRTAYPYTACVALSLSTEIFSSLPSRAYLVKGLKVQIPHNAIAQEDGRLVFDGNFNGSLTKSRFFTTCPVCIFYDLLINKRYGCGDFIDTNNLNWIDLYEISRYANELVDTPDGQEARFAINTVIGTQADAYKVLQNLASIFRGMTYWGSNTVNVVADHGNLKPENGGDAPDIDPVHLYTNSNVIDGVFSYSGSSLKTRSTSIQVTYNDPDNFYKPNVVVVEDYELIEKYGYNIKQIVAFGCSSKYQAQRMGQWVLNSEKLDGNVVSFKTGLDGLGVLPSQVFAVADEMRAGLILSGRILSVDSDNKTTKFTPDQNFDTYVGGSGDNFEVSVFLQDGTVEKQKISSINSSGLITVKNAFTKNLLAGAVYTLENKTFNPVLNQKFRCIDVKDNRDSTYTITGLEFNDSIYEVADNTTNNKAKLDYEDVTAFNNRPTKPENLEVTSTRIQRQNSSTNRITFSWSRGLNGSNVKFTVRYKIGFRGTYKKIKDIDETSINIDFIKSGKNLFFEVRSESIDAIGAKNSGYAKANKFTVPFKKAARVPTPLA
tara:strand:+ start:4799 stop:7171 length:2373 start_codon:yes stop_codon:yes gene_type:complete